MRQKHFIIIAALFLLFLLAAIADAAPGTKAWQVILKDNQTVQVYCTGDEIIITPYTDTEMGVTCRTWMENDK